MRGQQRRQRHNNNNSVEAEVIEEADRETVEEEAENLMIYTEVNCSTPSSGFYSEMGQMDPQQQQLALIQQQQQQLYQQHRLHHQQLYQPLYRPQLQDFEALYQSAEAVRLNKKLLAGQPMASPPTAGGHSASSFRQLSPRLGSNSSASDEVEPLVYDPSMPASFPIDEAVRMLQMSAQR
jgi:hypothetical protein